MLDAFEVQIIGSVIPGIQQEFGLGSGQAVVINILVITTLGLGWRYTLLSGSAGSGR